MKLTEKKIRDVARRKSGTTNTTGGVGGGGGASSLKQLSDTSISDEANEDVLVYNSTSSKWENKGKAPKAEKADEVPWTGVKNVVVENNEFNIIDGDFDRSDFYFNYRKRSGNGTPTAITDYYLGNGRNGTGGVTLHVDKIIIGGVLIEWDSAAQALKINGSVYATSTVGSLG